jgi:hypothetical protein
MRRAWAASSGETVNAVVGFANAVVVFAEVSVMAPSGFVGAPTRRTSPRTRVGPGPRPGVDLGGSSVRVPAN